MELSVKLGDVLVGTIRSQNDGRNEFAFAGEYLRTARRPVLGQYFEDHLAALHRSQTRLPPFFSNLLPEGGLRELVARRADVHPEHEVALIAVLGRDLPGAVVVEHLSDTESAIGPLDEPAGSSASETALRFSLAGAQLKFSVTYRRAGRGPTLAIDGMGGDWIAKLPSETYPLVPENEYAMVRWAGRVGIQVPEVRLVSVGDIEGLPIKLAAARQVFLSRRFDRPGPDRRIHQEDFAQVKNVRHGDRYGELGYASLARIVREVSGDEDFDEVVRRITFNVIIGNGDAHLKNWSLVYPDGVQARLSPAYDLVATIAYIPGDKLALKLARENRFEHIHLHHFTRLAERAGVVSERVIAIVRETIQRALDAWPTGELDTEQERLIRAHVERLPLVREAARG